MSSPNFPTIDRRAFLGGLGLSAIAVPLAAEAQQAGKVYRIGILHSAARESERIKALEEGLRELGYVEGRNLVIEHRFADVKLERLGELATDLVRLKVDVIVTAINPTTLAAKQATTTIPIVMTTGVDPVAAGLVASLARPGGNVTGLTFDVDPEAIAAKRLELLKELAPRASRMAAIWNPTYAPNTPRMKGIEDAARKLGVTLVSVLVREPGDFDGAFATIVRERARAFLVLTDPLMFSHFARLADLAAKNRLPGIYALREAVNAGGLISYAANLVDLYRRAALFVDKIIKGAKPADLPIEQPTKFELVINMKTAKALGLTIPQSLLVRADEVIQ